VGVIRSLRLPVLLIVGFFFLGNDLKAQSTYKKRVLETIEVDILTSLYTQEGDNAAVTGGIGTEKLLDFTPTIVISIPLNADDVLTIDAGISAYSSASSSNVNPFDGNGDADAFVESSGASGADVLTSALINYSHSSNDRNTILNGKLSISSEYDYFSFGIGSGITKLFNEKNTEVTLSVNAYFDSWSLIYPIELRNNRYRSATYAPSFTGFNGSARNSYSVGLLIAQILGVNLQGSFSLDLVLQDGLLSTPFQRVYFSDAVDNFVDNFHLADDIERLPNSRFKVAGGTRLNYYISEVFILRTFYRYYQDDWGISSNTAQIELPISIGDNFTLYPSYRFYNQTKADHFAAYNQHLSTDEFYTSDYDLSTFKANQIGFGINYTDLFTDFRIGPIGLKSIDARINRYERDSGLSSLIFMLGTKFIIDY